jgi:hypothetical protein
MSDTNSENPEGSFVDIILLYCGMYPNTGPKTINVDAANETIESIVAGEPTIRFGEGWSRYSVFWGEIHPENDTLHSDFFA